MDRFHGHFPRLPGPADRLLQPTDPGYDNYCSRHPLPVPDPAPQGLGRTQTERCQFGSMLKVLDQAVANVTAALRAQGQWDRALVLMLSDNGGIGPGSNYPLRGQKNTPWQGGTRVAAYATGGFIPPELRGARFGTTLHFADLYPTLCGLVGVDPADTVVLGGLSRPIDGVDFWPLLLASAGGGGNGSTPQLREYLATTEDSIVWRGRWKLITKAAVGGAFWFPPQGRGPNNTAVPVNATQWPCVNATGDGGDDGGCMLCSPAKPCLFDLVKDESERTNIRAQHPGVVVQLAAELARANNNTYVDGTMSPQQLAGYDCEPAGGRFPSAWWGNFSGPCCRPKAARRRGATREDLS